MLRFFHRMNNTAVIYINFWNSYPANALYAFLSFIAYIANPNPFIWTFSSF